MSSKLRVVGAAPKSFRALAQRVGFVLTDDAPDILVAYGGDGTLMGAEREYPNVPKLGLRKDDSCAKCPKHTDEAVLRDLAAGRLAEERLLKIECTAPSGRLLAMNDVIFRNADLRAAVRFTVELNGAVVTEEVIGDGFVAATPFGSSAYFRSITHLTFRTGIGLAFNNCTDFQPHLVVRETDVLAVRVTRGPAMLTCDNDPQQYASDEGDVLVLKAAPGATRLLGPDTLRCPDCRYKHAPRRRY